MSKLWDMMRRGFAWVCPTDGFSAEERLRARVMSLACIIMGVLQFANAGHSLLIGDIGPGMPVLAASVGTIILMTALLPRFTTSADIYGGWIGLVALIGFFLASQGSDPNAIDGGTGLSEMPLVVGCIMFVAMVGSRRTTILYFVGALALIGHMLYVSSQAGLPVFDWEVMKHRANQAVMGLILVGVCARFMIETVFANYQRLRAERDRAEFAEAKRADLLATMSHEIRTPLGGIVGIADLLATVQPGEHIELIRRSADHLMHIVNGVLDQSKGEAGAIIPQPVEANMAAVIEDCCALYRPKAEAKMITIQTQIDEGLSKMVHKVDATLLRQALNNLIGNAVKFTEVGGVCVGVRRAGDSALQFYVQDTGAGVAAADQARILERYQQSESSGRTTERGTGLGLSITHDIIHAMGGALLINSEPGRGSVFSFVLPVERIELPLAA